MATDIKLQKLFDKMGVTLNILTNRQPRRYFQAFLQPLRYKNKIYLRGVPTELGFDNLNKFLLIAPLESNLDQVKEPTDKLYLDLEHLNIDHCERVYFKQEPLYFWAIVSKETQS